MRDPNPHVTMSMCEVKAIRGPLLTLIVWDLGDQEIDHVFAGLEAEPTIEVGSVHLMELIVRDGHCKLGFCSPAYEEVSYEEEDDMEY